MDSDVLLLIFERLDADALSSAERSCKSWAIIGALAWRALALRDWPGKRTSRFHALLVESANSCPSYTSSFPSAPFTWRQYYAIRKSQAASNIRNACNSLLYNLELYSRRPKDFYPITMFDVFESETFADCSNVPRSLPTVPLHRNMFERTPFCHLHPAIYACADSLREYDFAKRFLISHLYIALEVDTAHTVPIVQSVRETSHPCIVKVDVDSDSSHNHRSSYLCFTETMEVVDSQLEGTVDGGYRRLLECTEDGSLKVKVGNDHCDEDAEERFLHKLLRKEQTLLANFPHAIATQVHYDPDRFVLARRYVFCNSKFHVLDDDTEDIAPWLSPLEEVANVIPPKIYGSREVFLVHCAMGFSRIIVLIETGQVLHTRGTSRGQMWQRLLRFGRIPHHGDVPPKVPPASSPSASQPSLTSTIVGSSYSPVPSSSPSSPTGLLDAWAQGRKTWEVEFEEESDDEMFEC